MALCVQAGRGSQDPAKPPAPGSDLQRALDDHSARSYSDGCAFSGTGGGAGPAGGMLEHRMEPIDLDTLPTMAVKHLRDRWIELGIGKDPPHFKQALVRGIAWHIQQQKQCGMDAQTRRLLKATIRNASACISKSRSTTKRKRRNTIRLRTGTTLVRTWHGRKHQVTVLDAGKRFRYRQKEYASLSEIARDITGTRWSGPRFFGLKIIKGVA